MNDNSNDLDDLYTRFKTMSYEDLKQFEQASKVIGRICNICGVSIVLLMLIIPQIILIGIGTIIVFLLAKIAAGISETKIHIETNMARFKAKR